MKHLIGIDLGTTNTVLYSMPQDQETIAPELFQIQQIVAPGESAAESALPSFVYLPDEKDLPAQSLDLPWASGRDFCVGAFARDAAAKNPAKVVSSAKSWLCVQTVDRNSAFLPLNRNLPERQISPVDASLKILEHLRDAWNQQAKTEEDKLEHQEIVLTVPASFDTVARELTVQAAEKAGFQVRLLEEPLAAFYCFLNENMEQWRKELNVGETVLVCDIGGGTSDFTLVKIREEEGNLTFERAAVGRHLLLGGDNMDLTLAYALSAKLKAERKIVLDSHQMTGLTHACRAAKERLFNDPQKESEPVTVLGRGSSIIGGTIKTELTRQELNQILMNGFFPECELTDTPAQAAKSALRSFALPYESDPAITRNLAEFLNKQLQNGVAFPSVILFNGGVTKSAEIRERILAVLRKWNGKEMVTIHGSDPDRSVAKGACAYAAICQGKGIRVKAGSSRSYYVGVESSMPAVPGFATPMQGLCVVPFGMEEGSENEVESPELALLIGEHAEFKFFSSTTRIKDQPGTTADDILQDPDFEQLPSLAAWIPEEEGLPAGSLIPVRLHCRLTETGTLAMDCISPDGKSWKLDFELRKNTAE